MVLVMRSYGQYCAIARALDVVGDRWSLLIVRELLIRPCRFGELRDGLPGIATNMLSDRLRGLEELGIVQRSQPDPVGGAARYELTEHGQQLKVVIEDLIRWGTRLMAEPQGDDAFRSRWLAIAMQAILRRRRSDPTIVVQLETGDEPLIIESTGTAVRVYPGQDTDADAVIAGPPDAILAYLIGRINPRAARRRGLTTTGDPAAVTALQDQAR
jgi:DNA-binding HxlR family transcriptional regulator